MTDDRFNELLRGPLYHPMIPFAISRLALALKCVVDATGEAGEKALEAYCAERQERDADSDDADGLLDEEVANADEDEEESNL